MPRSVQTGFATFSLENLLLGLLMAQPKHGYQLYQDYEAHFRPIWQVGRSKFYAALAALHDAGFLDVQTEFQDDHPPRKVYHLTAAGREHFAEWLYHPVMPMRAVRVEFLAKLRFITLLSLEHPEQILDAQIEACQATLAALERRGRAEPPTDPVLDLVHDFRRRQALFLIEWLRACRERLQQGAFV